MEFAARREADRLIPRSGRLLSNGITALDQSRNSKDIDKYWDGVGRVLTIQDDLGLVVPMVVNDAWIAEDENSGCSRATTPIEKTKLSNSERESELHKGSTIQNRFVLCASDLAAAGIDAINPDGTT